MRTIRRDTDIHREESGGYVLRFHFSFKSYQDAAYDGFGPLRLFNDDRKVGVLGNRMHRHADVEVVTYIVEGTFRHEDSLGNAFVLRAGSVECLSAGTGVEHAEHNASEVGPLRMILMYFVPDAIGLTPSVTHRTFTAAERSDRWCRIAGPPELDDGAVVIHQQAHLYAAVLEPQAQVAHSLLPARGAYLYVIRGEATIGEQVIATGDAGVITDEVSFDVQARTRTELLLVDVPPLGVSRDTDAAIKGDVRVTDESSADGAAAP